MKNNIKKYINKNIETYRFNTGELDYFKLAESISLLFNKNNNDKIFQQILDYILIYK
jgi:hypothetical protein